MNLAAPFSLGAVKMGISYSDYCTGFSNSIYTKILIVPTWAKVSTWYININSYFYLQLKSQIRKPEKFLDWEDNRVHGSHSHAVVPQCLIQCNPTQLVNSQLYSPYLTVIIPCVSTEAASDYSKWDAREWWSILIRTRAHM